jgi:hypothetical protein
MADEDNEEFEVSCLLEGTIALHELFSTFIRGGFTEDQALKLISHQIHLNGGFVGE